MFKHICSVANLQIIAFLLCDCNYPRQHPKKNTFRSCFTKESKHVVIEHLLHVPINHVSNLKMRPSKRVTRKIIKLRKNKLSVGLNYFKKLTQNPFSYFFYFVINFQLKQYSKFNDLGKITSLFLCICDIR